MGEVAKERNAKGATRQPEGTTRYRGVPQWSRTHTAGDRANQNRGPLPRRQDPGPLRTMRLEPRLPARTAPDLYQQSSPRAQPGTEPGAPHVSPSVLGTPTCTPGGISARCRERLGGHTNTHTRSSLPTGLQSSERTLCFLPLRGHLTPSQHQTAQGRMAHKGGRYFSTREDLHVSPTGKSEPEVQGRTRTEGPYRSD